MTWRVDERSGNLGRYIVLDERGNTVASYIRGRAAADLIARAPLLAEALRQLDPNHPLVARHSR